MKIIDDTEMSKHFQTKLRVADADYLCPSKSWVKKTLNPFFKSFLKFHKVGLWKKHFDCDNFASGYFFLAQVLHGQRKDKVPEAVAVGEVWYTTRKGGGHAINCVFLDSKDGALLKFIEPQTCKWLELTPKERGSIYFVRF